MFAGGGFPCNADGERRERRAWHAAQGPGVLTLPTFICVGAGRAGTSSLYQYFKAHPQICMSPLKEINYFGIRSVAASGDDGMSAAAYARYFRHHAEERQVGEASPAYLCQPGAAEEMADLLGDACRVLMVLRAPLARMLSQMSHHADHHGYTDADAYAARALAGFHAGQLARFDWYAPVKNLRQSLYATALATYQALFPPEHLLVLRFDDMQADPVGFCARICDFLGVDAARDAARLLPRSNEAAPARKISPAISARLHAVFNPDIRRTAALSGLDLSGWLG